jgi:hypothetical protein
VSVSHLASHDQRVAKTVEIIEVGRVRELDQGKTHGSDLVSRLGQATAGWNAGSDSRSDGRIGTVGHD